MQPPNFSDSSQLFKLTRREYLNRKSVQTDAFSVKGEVWGSNPRPSVPQTDALTN